MTETAERTSVKIYRNKQGSGGIEAKGREAEGEAREARGGEQVRVQAHEVRPTRRRVARKSHEMAPRNGARRPHFTEEWNCENNTGEDFMEEWNC